MTPKQADKIIKENKPVTVINTFYNEKFIVHIVKRDRFNVYGINNEVYDRGNLQLITEATE